jgi:hypothetical protein
MSWSGIVPDAWLYARSRRKWWLLLVLLLLIAISWLIGAAETSLIAPYLYPLF